MAYDLKKSLRFLPILLLPLACGGGENLAIEADAAVSDAASDPAPQRDAMATSPDGSSDAGGTGDVDAGLTDTALPGRAVTSTTTYGTCPSSLDRLQPVAMDRWEVLYPRNQDEQTDWKTNEDGWQEMILLISTPQERTELLLRLGPVLTQLLSDIDLEQNYLIFVNGHEFMGCGFGLTDLQVREVTSGLRSGALHVDVSMQTGTVCASVETKTVVIRIPRGQGGPPTYCLRSLRSLY